MKTIPTLGIGCIGSGVGQSVINSCRLSRMSLRTLGLGTNPLAYGLYECDGYAITRSFYDEGYLDELLAICEREKVDLLTPGHDDEADLFSKNLSRLQDKGIEAIVSGPDLLNLCRDKELMSNQLNPVADVFVKSFGRDAFLKAFQAGDVHLPVIAKPRDGYASRGIAIILTEADFGRITDLHIVQELAIPHRQDVQHEAYLRQLRKGINPQIAEISIQLVAHRDGSLIGRMATYNKLNNGIPIEILPYENDYVWSVIDRLYPTLVAAGLRGPLNLQGRLTDQGLKLFEMNARFTGITGLRAMMGFNEVEACIKHWLTGEIQPPLCTNQAKAGIRQTEDKVVRIDHDPRVAKTVQSLNGKMLKPKPTLLVTGSTGSIGRLLVQDLTKAGHNVWTLDRDKDKARQLFSHLGAMVYDWADWEAGRLVLGNVDRIIHLGFARPHHPAESIALSLNRTIQLFSCAAETGVSDIINISSQSVYGQGHPPPWTEAMAVAPDSPYAQAKYAVECHLAALGHCYRGLRHTSIRLETVTGAHPELEKNEALAKMVSFCHQNNKLVVMGGEQKMARCDIRDAVSGLLQVVRSHSAAWKPCYNLGSGVSFTLLAMAEAIREALLEREPDRKIVLEMAPATNSRQFGLSIDSFNHDFSWQPKFGLKESITLILDR